MKCFAYIILLFTLFSCQQKRQTNSIDDLYNQSIGQFNDKKKVSDLDLQNLNGIKIETISDSAKFFIIKARYFYLNDRVDDAIACYLNSFRLAKLSNVDSLIYKSALELSSPYSQIGKYDSALNYLFEAEKAAVNLKSDINIGFCYSKIAQLFQVKGDINEAKVYVYKATPLIKDNDAYYYNNQLTLANIYGMSGNIDSALIIDNISLKDLTKKNNSTLQSFFYNNKGNCYMFSNKFDSAEFYFKKCLTIDLKTNQSKQIADSYSCLLTLYTLFNDTAKIKQTAETALQYCTKTNYFIGKQQVYENLSSYYKNKKQVHLALIYKDSSLINYKKSLTLSAENKISELKVEYDTEKKEQQIAENDKQIFLQNIIIIVASILLLAISRLFYYYHKLSKRKKSEAIYKAEQNQKEIANKSLFEAEQKERNRIARELHDSVGQMLAYVKMQNNEDVDAPISKAIDKTILEVRNITHELMPPELNFGLAKALETLINEAKLKSDINIDELFYSIVFTDTFSISIYRIIQELINNTIKHAQASELFFTIKEENNNMVIYFLTNGKNINEEKLHNTHGIGWQNILYRLLLINGKIKIYTNKDKNGFILTLNLPNEQS